MDNKWPHKCTSLVHWLCICVDRNIETNAFIVLNFISVVLHCIAHKCFMSFVLHHSLPLIVEPFCNLSGKQMYKWCWVYKVSDGFWGAVIKPHKSLVLPKARAFISNKMCIECNWSRTSGFINFNFSLVAVNKPHENLSTHDPFSFSKLCESLH